jgi:cytochrome c
VLPALLCLGLAQTPPRETQGDAARGRALYEARCIACHTVEVSLVGPAHRGVMGRRAGSLPGYEYSAALKAARLVWTRKTLDAWLTNPERLLPGQKMWFSVPDARDRRDLIAWLETLRASRGARAPKPSPGGERQIARP